MYFNFEDNHPDITPVGHAISWREGILLSIIFHLLATITILVVPPLDSKAAEERIAQQLALQRQRERDSARFVFIQPHLDMPATRPPSPRAEASDKDRNAQTRERAPNPKNALPFSRGNTPERVEALKSAPPGPRAQREAPPQPSAPNAQSQADAGSPPPSTSDGFVLPGPRAGNGRVPEAPAAAGMGAGRGILGSAMRDLRQMVQQGQFDNPEGGGNGAFGPSIQFDSKGVEFGPWLRRFVAQIKRNWMIPYAAMAMKGHVVVTFYIMKDGTITQLAVPGPCNVDAFNRAAYNAMATSNPTYPLPPEYPADRAFFTVTFYYNEAPPGGGS